MVALALLERLRKNGITIYGTGSELKLKAPEGTITKELVEEIRLYKNDLLALLEIAGKTETVIAQALPASDYPVTEQQKSIWIISQDPLASVAYNMPLLLRFDEEVQVTALEQALQDLVDRHEVFRTSFFHNAAGEIRQAITEVNITIHLQDITGLSAEQWNAVVYKESMQLFDLQQAPLLRVRLLQKSRNCYYLVLVIHHIIADGASLALLQQELLQAYVARKQGSAVQFPPLSLTYKDYANWQYQKITGGAWTKEVSYWQQVLQGELPVLQLVSGKRPPVKTNAGQHMSLLLAPHTTAQLAYFCKTHKVSFFAGLLSALNILFYRYTGNEDILVGTVTAGRDQPGLDNLAGLFINTLPVRIAIPPSESFLTILLRQQQVLEDAYAHQELPFSYLVELTGKHRDLSRSAIFDNMIIYNDHRNAAPANKETKVTFLQQDQRTTSQLDTTFIFQVTQEGVQLDIEFNTDVYDSTTIQRLAGHYQNLLESLLSDAGLPVGQLSYLSDAEQHQLLHAFNNTGTVYEKGRTLAGLFKMQVAAKGEETALLFRGQSFSYQTLHRRSNSLAAYLTFKYGLVTEDTVMVCLPRSEWLIIALLSVLKAGCAYVPVDPAYPAKRLNYIKADSGSKVCIDEAELKNFFAVENNYTSPPQQNDITENNLAYIIYTSGSTGEPKGCMLEHKGVVNRLEWMWRQYNFNQDDVVLQKTTFTFDVSVWEIFMPLCYGCKMVLCEDEQVYSMPQLANLIAAHNITCLHFVPGMLDTFMDVQLDTPAKLAALASLKRVITSGEALSLKTVKLWYSKLPVPIYNLYGPTEASIDVSYFDTTPFTAQVLIGKPVANTALYILDARQNLVPVGITGEICIGGIQLARGYLNKPALTAEKFISHPFENGARLYRTGDLGRWLPDGNIEYLGRMDTQVKIRGFRIEPGEVEHNLLQWPAIDQCVVTAPRKMTGDHYLAAYFTAREQVSVQVLKQWLGNRLPAYMVPAYFIQVDQFSLTASGKIDRKKLPLPDETSSGNPDLVVPRNQAEQDIAAMWCNVLKHGSVSVTDNFFDIGGDSIKAIRLVSLIRNHFNKELKVHELYTCNTIEKIALRLQEDPLQTEHQQQRVAAIAQQLEDLQEEVLKVHPHATEIAAVYPMSDIQQGMIFGSLVNDALSIYHEQFVYHLLYPAFDLTVFTKAFTLLVNKHETLRTAFNFSDYSQPVQIVWKTVPVHINYEDITATSPTAQQEILTEFMRQERTRPFDCMQAPLWRINLYQCAGNRIVYLLQFHHALLDGWSVASLNTELHLLYARLLDDIQYNVPLLHCNNRHAIEAALLVKEEVAWQHFWKQALHGYKRLDIFAADSVLEKTTYTYEPAYLQQLTARAKADQVAVKTLFFAAWLYALKTLTYEEDITVGLVTNTRPEKPDGDKVLGCFLNTVPVRFPVKPAAATWRRYVQDVEAYLQTIKKYDRVSLQDIRKVTGETSGQDNPFYDVMFNFINFHVYEQLDSQLLAADKELPGIDSYEVANAFLAMDVNTTGEQLQVTYTLTRKFKSGTSLAEFHTYLHNVLTAFINYPDEITGTDSVLPQEVKEKLLGFNNTAAPYPSDKTIVDLFSQQVAQGPNQVALVYEGVQVSYRTLDEQTNRLARYLQKQGVTSGTVVPVCLDRSAKLVIALLSVLKAGGVYVPIDPAYPQERILFMMEDCGSALVITDAQHKSLLEAATAAAVILVDEIPAEVDQLFMPVIDSTSLAYVIYTSGSTGKPKGVQIAHGSVVNLIHWHIGRYGVLPGSRSTAMAGVGFDAFALEIWSALLSGSVLYLLKDELKLDAEALLSFYASAAITHAFVPPALIPGLVNQRQPQGLALQYVLIGGDRLAETDISHLSYTLVNQYGPTESTVMVTDYFVTTLNGKLPPIGKPIANTELYVLDKAQQLVPAGVAGELYIGGVQLAQGYLNRPALTAEKFIAHPFQPGKRLYRSGDLVRWQPDGNLEYIGRLDEQVKIRGHRVEIGEIAYALQQLPGITAAIVVIRQDAAGQSLLAAYYTGDLEQQEATLRRRLQQLLPDYMVPARLIGVESFPLTAHGKVDQSLLPDPFEAGMGGVEEYTGPRNAIEEALTIVYGEVLNRERVSTGASFFELGGDSIKAILLINRLKQRGYTVKVGDVLKYPVVSELALQVRVSVQESWQGQVTGETPLTPVQHWFLSSSYGYKHHYNQSVLLYSSEQIDVSLLSRCLLLLTDHHDGLRMRYEQYTLTGAWRQYTAGAAEKGYELYCYDEGSLVSMGKSREQLSEELQGSFNLSSGPLLKVCLFRSGAGGGDELLLIAHHLVIDGVSWRILLEDLFLLYEQLQQGGEGWLPLKSDSFQRWSLRLQEYAGSAALQHELTYWKKVVNTMNSYGTLAVVQGAHPLSQNKDLGFTLPEALTTALLTQVNKVYHTDINDILLAALSWSVQQVFRLPVVTATLEGHGREELFADVNIGRTIGWFTSAYPVILEAAGNSSLQHYLITVKETLRQVPQKGIGYGLLRYCSRHGSELENTFPAFLSFNYLGDFSLAASPQKEQNLFTYSPQYRGREINPAYEPDTTLSVTGMTIAGKLQLIIGYSGQQYRDEIIEELVKTYEVNLQALIQQLLQAGKTYLTPSDVTYGLLSMQELQVIGNVGEIEDIYPLSPLQEGIYYHWLSEPGTTNYVEQTWYRVKGSLNITILQKSYEHLVNRHPVLRTAFTHEYGAKNLQIVRKIVKAAFLYKDVTDAEDPQAAVVQYRQQDRQKGFDLATGSQMRLTVLQLNDHTYEFVWTHHHILMDGWCTSVLMNEFYELYGSLLHGVTPVINASQPYSAYIKWLEGLDKTQSLSYWQQYLEGYESTATIPYKENSTEKTPYILEEIYLDIDAAQLQAMQAICRQVAVTESVFIQSAWAYLLSCYNNTKDVVFGAVVSGRPGELNGIETMIGLFINTIPVRIQLAGVLTVQELLKQVQQDFIDSLPYHYTQLSEIQSQHVLRNRLFDHPVAYLNFPVQTITAHTADGQGLASLQLIETGLVNQPNYGFNIIASTLGEGIRVVFRYNGACYSQASIDRVKNHFSNIIRAFTTSAGLPLAKVDYLSQAEQQQLLVDFNATGQPYPAQATIPGLFAARVLQIPHAPALVYEGMVLTYQQLNEQTNRLAHYLRRLGVHEQTPVLVCIDRSVELVISLLGVLKAGGAYIPVDPDYPAERIAYMLADSGAGMIITHSYYKEVFEEAVAPHKIMIDTDWPAIEQEPAVEPQLNINARQLAYIIYTSGSTGKPKGVMIEHTAVVNLICWHIQRYQVSNGSRSTMMAGVGFDAAALEMWSALLSGSTLFIVKNEIKLHADALLDFFREHAITHAFVPPALIPGLVNQPQPATLALKYVLIGGDRLPEVDTSRISYVLVNQYGPTESTVMVTDYPIYHSNGKLPPIGKPIANTSVYLLDAEKRLVPAGVPGELYIGGVQLARGYLNNPVLTQEKFIEHPYRPGYRLYRTGDLARWLPDGNIEYLGRTDDQVKIRGYRIETGEIEYTLRQSEGVEDALVTVYQDAAGNKTLVAYFTGAEEPDLQAIRRTLAARLPEYMVPQLLIPLQKFPLTLHGKIDRQALPQPEEQAFTSDVIYVAPANALEEVLVEVYADVLNRSGIGVKDNFFDLGGDSIKAILLINRLKQKGYTVKVGDVLKYPVIEQLAEQVVVAVKDISQDVVEGDVLLTPVQQWFFEKRYTNKHHYNQSVLLEAPERIDVELLHQVLQLLTRHHDALRMVYRQKDGQWQQYNQPATGNAFHLEVHNRLQQTYDAGEEAAIYERVQQAMHLEEGPLLRVALLQLPAGDRLLLVLHHLVTDGVSWRILLEDISTLYQQLRAGQQPLLPSKTHSFREWAARLQQYAGQHIALQELPYWQSVIQQGRGVPVDFPGGTYTLATNVSAGFELGTEETELLMTKVNRVYNTEINDILLTALALAVRQVFNQSAILVELEGHGREELFEEINISRTVGWFTSIYPVRLVLHNTNDADNELVQVKEQLRSIPRKGIGYGILRYLQTTGKLLLNNAWKGAITFNYLGDFGTGVSGGSGKQQFAYCEAYKGLEIDPAYEVDHALAVTGLQVAGRLRLIIGYSSSQFRHETISRLLTDYQQQLLGLINSLQQEENNYYTPSDFSYKGLSMADIKALSRLGEPEDVYPLSPLQEGIYYHWLAGPGTGNYIGQTTYRVKGVLNVDVLQKSYAFLVNRHAILRTSFNHHYGSKVLQIVWKAVTPDFRYITLENIDNIDAYCNTYKKQDRAAGFELNRGSQMRLTIIKLGEEEYEFVWCHHHILMDGWCSSLLVSEFYKVYASLLVETIPVLNPVHSYARYINWLAGVNKAESLAYWKQYLQLYEHISAVPFRAYTAAKETAYVKKEISLVLDREMLLRIQAVCRETGITENTFIQGAWAYLLSCYNNTQDVVFGSVVSGRPGELKGVEEMIGLFINTIPVRFQYTPVTTIRQFLQQAQQASIGSLPHHYIQLSEVTAQSTLKSDLFDHLFIYENYPVQAKMQEGIGATDGLEKLQLIDSAVVEQTNYDFNITVVPGTDGTHIIFGYNNNAYAGTAVQQIKEHLLQVIENFTGVLDLPLQAVDYLSVHEQHLLLQQWNDTGVTYEKEQETIVSLFEAQVALTPYHIAVVFEEEVLTYRQLNAKADSLAFQLQQQNIGPDHFVPLIFSRGIDYVVAFLAVLKTGAAVVPLSIDWPAARLESLLAEIASPVVLCNAAGLKRSGLNNTGQFITVQQAAIPISTQAFINRALPQAPIYMFYTSGTTGRPKGVVVPHKGITNRFLWMNEYFGTAPAASVLRTTRHIFDSSVWQLFWPLINGGKTVIPAENIPFDLHYFCQLIQAYSITMTDFVPSLFNELVNQLQQGAQEYDLSTLHDIIVGGEAITVAAANQFRKKYPAIRLTNLYGPTEASIGCIFFELTDQAYSSIPIGKPIANTSIYIVDKNGRLLPPGITGEICIAGRCLAQGYFRDAEKTAQKFVPNPFAGKDGSSPLYYRTGDLGRRMADGNIEYVGRCDDQLKIRGYRIEPSEIENAIRSIEQVKAALVTAFTSPAGSKELTAYFIASDAIEPESMYAALTQLLPAYMIPRFFIQVEEWPLTAGGKIDKKQLPDPAGPVADAKVPYVAPRNEVEEKLVIIWQQVLNYNEPVGIYDNFFVLGGHSIRAIMVLSGIRKEFNLTLGLKELFENPTIEHLARKIQNIGWLQAGPMQKTPDQDYVKMEI